MPQILIDRKTCSKCNTCATVCVMGIIDKSTALNHPTIPEEKLDYCLKCGHCESFCAQKALTLDFLLDEKINTSFLDSQIELDIPVILTTRFGDIDHPLGCVSLNTMA